MSKQAWNRRLQSSLLWVSLLALALVLAGPHEPIHAQSSASAEVLGLVTPDDYGEFESLGTLVLSPRGDWLAATVGRVEGDGEVRLHQTATDSVIVVERGTRAAFAETGLWAAVEVQPGEDERRRLQQAGDPVRNDLVLVDLQAGTLHERSEVASWAFSPDGELLFFRRYRSENGDSRGADMGVRELATGVEVNFGNVAEASWHDLEPVLAMIVDAEGMAGNGVRTWHASSETLRTLTSAEASFSDLTWREDAGDLAVLRVDPDTGRGDTLRAVVAWQRADGADPTMRELEGEIQGGEEGPLRITDFRGLSWSDDGTRIFFGAVPRDTPLPPEEDEDDPESEEDDPSPDSRARGDAERDTIPGLEIWHARDVDPVPQQRLRANQARRASEIVAWEVESGRTVVLGGMDGDHDILPLPGQATALLLDSRPYREERMFGPVYRDVYRVDVDTGDRELLGERIEHFYGGSPGGRYALFFEGDQWHAVDVATGGVTDLTSGLDGVFVNEEFDRTVPQKPPYGQGGWLEDDAAVLIYDRYDVWRVAPDGTGERLTQGAEDELRHRVVRLDPDQDAFPADEPLYLSLYGEWTKRSGYGRLHSDGRMEELIYEDRSIGRLARATDADRYLYVAQRYDLPSDAYLTDGSFNGSRQVTRVNDGVLERFHWGHSELVDYDNESGERLQGALFYPANYDPDREYPLIVYPYERLSQTLHSWMNPTDRNAYNTTVFTQNEYFVLRPDIVYRDRNPGLSFMEAVVPALDAALAAAPIDPERVGLTGHSWGGYQTTFAVTQTDRFAAAVAGAPLTNLMSMYLSFYWNTGGTDARIFEISQGRMEVPWWEDFESYRANSPVHHIEAMQTPLLMAFGTEDGAVEFNQGVEFYNAARRAGKDFVLLVYEGENHSLQQRPNQIDYHRRALEWFNHYLKGHEAPAWITEGASFLDQEEKLKRGPAAGRVVGAGQDGGS